MLADERLFIGAMTGTSADGIDAALVAIDGRGAIVRARLIGHVGRPLSRDLRHVILTARNQGHVTLPELAGLTRDLTMVYADAISDLLAAHAVHSRDVTAIGAHGQTLYHDPPLTMQCFDPSLLAARVDAVVISDFRRADCAAGGQGAPLVPWADWVVFRHATLSRAIVNIGGIANITYLPAGGDIQTIAAFDTGPGNCISDDLVSRSDPAGPGYDQGGQRALRGRVSIPLAQQILRHTWFARRPPKSTDGPAMIRIFRNAVDQSPVTISDDELLATAAFVTGRSITNALRDFAGPVDQLIVAGGGVANAAVMQAIAESADNATVLSSDSLGVPTQAREAMAFAILAAATIDGIPANVPAATGAQRGVICGSITPRL
jgi:anhydro-N-acetylmuramic acid kinase